MATATPPASHTPGFKEEKYERIVLEPNPQQEQEIEQAKGKDFLFSIVWPFKVWVIM